MPWWAYVMIAMASMVQAMLVTILSWEALSIIKLQQKYVEMETKLIGLQTECHNRLIWLRTEEEKIDDLLKAVSRIEGSLRADRNTK